MSTINFVSYFPHDTGVQGTLIVLDYNTYLYEYVLLNNNVELPVCWVADEGVFIDGSVKAISGEELNSAFMTSTQKVSLKRVLYSDLQQQLNELEQHKKIITILRDGRSDLHFVVDASPGREVLLQGISVFGAPSGDRDSLLRYIHRQFGNITHFAST